MPWEMALHRKLFAQVWRRRSVCVLVTMAITLMVMLLATWSLQQPRNRGASVADGRRQPHSKSALQHPFTPTLMAGGVKEGHTSRTQSRSNPRWQLMERRRRGLPPVVFLKTHKTGSSTVQNILFRLGDRENATFAFPYYTYQFSYPERFRVEFVDELPAGSSQFNMLCSHMRLDLPQLRLLMPRNTVYLTLLRDPVSVFESVFTYYTSVVPAFQLARKASRNLRKPPLRVFLDDPKAFWDPEEPRNGLARNPQSFDLGLSSQSLTSGWAEALAGLEQDFQLVMIAEHFDESLVLLRDLLKLELEDVVYVRLNARPTEDVPTLDADARGQIRAWNALDTHLYDYFLQVFWERAAEFGLERLHKGVRQLRGVVEEVRRRCLAREEGVPPEELEDLVRPWQPDTVTILGYELRGNLSERDLGLCVRLVLPELQYHSHLYFKQYGRDMRSVPSA